jgi:ATP-dependent DNA helicase PIF1
MLAGDAVQDCETALYPLEFVNSCSLSGIPDHIITLKKGAPYIIMHNTSSVLCNGTRVIYHRRVGKCLEVEICSGERKGEYHYLPRLVLTAKTVSLPFSLRRVQYPIQPCFAM